MGKARHSHTNAQASLWETPAWPRRRTRLGRPSQRSSRRAAAHRQALQSTPRVHSSDLWDSPSAPHGQLYDLCTGAPFLPSPSQLIQKLCKFLILNQTPYIQNTKGGFYFPDQTLTSLLSERTWVCPAPRMTTIPRAVSVSGTSISVVSD